MTTKLEALRRHASKHQLIALILFIVIGGLGVYLLTAGHAQSPYATAESENGTLASGATKTADTNASGGNYVKYSGGSTGTPAYCATGGAQLWANLELCGWPGPTNTGYPAGTTFKTTSARTITADNTVIDGEKITGNNAYQVLEINAKNVTIKNSWIINHSSGGGESSVIHLDPGASAIISHVTLDGTGTTHLCTDDFGASIEIAYVNCSNTEDGFGQGCFGGPSQCGGWTGNNFNIHDSYVHDPTTNVIANGHIDSFQTEGASNGTIRHNTLDNKQDQDSAIAIWNSERNSDSITVDNNLMAGGGFNVYAEDYSPSENSPSGGFSTTNITFTNNKFSTIHFKCVGQFGVWYSRPSLLYGGGPTDGWHRTGNKVLETGESIDSGNPHSGSTLCS